MCRFIVWGFALAYAFALAILLIGLFGLFGQERDPLSAVYLLPLGLPWNLLTGGAPEPVLPILAALAPAVNLGLLVVLCRLIRRSAAP